MHVHTLDELIDEFNKNIDALDRDSLISLTDDVLKYTNQYHKALEEIESLTRNPKEYEPSIYTLHYISNKALNGKD